ncbi:hypothetical protein HQ576_15395 [bacterium]|nr:hypothetical protein [bacterium]
MARLRQTYTLRNGIPFISTKSRLHPMMTHAVLEQPLPPANRAHAQRYPANVARYRGYFDGPRRDPRASMPGPKCDNLWRYTPVHDEYERSTAVVHATLAAMEGFPYVWNDLSEEYAHHLCITRLRGSCRQNLDLRATHAAAILTDGVCPEHLWPYTSTLSKLPVRHAAPPAAIAQARYRIADSRFVEDFGEEGASIRNPRYLEAVLDCGYAIVCSMYACWDDADNHGTLDVLLDPATGDPVHPDVTRAGHCMLLVGYDRDQQHFIARNCWGQEWGHNGYAHLSYDYLATYARHGFYILGVTGIPNPGRVLPVYRDAPYAKKPIRITLGSHKIIFARTEQNNYARFELVAGHSHVELREIHTARPDAIPLLCTPSALFTQGRHLDLEAGRASTHSSFVDVGVGKLRQGQFDLVPQNGAGLYELLDVGAIVFKDVKTTRMDDDEIPAYHLGGSVVLVKTESGRYARCVVNAIPGELVFSHIIVWNSDGKVHQYRLGWRLPRTGSIDIDLDDLTLRSDQGTDLRWVKSTNPARPDHLIALPRSLLKLHTRVPPLY